MNQPSRSLRVVYVAANLGFLLGCTSVPKNVPDDGRNVLLIVADDLNCSLGCYGDSSAFTPHIDNLADQGARFAQAHCQYPLCGPSRTSFLTGLYPSQSGVRENRVLLRDALPSVVTLPQLFRQNGYDVVRIGKLFHYDNPGEIGTAGQDDNPSWDETYNPAGRDKREEHLIHSLVQGRFGGTLSWYRSLGNDEEYTDGMVAQIARRKLEEFADSQVPFFLAVGFFRPHTPFLAPSKYFDFHPLEGIDVPNREEDSWRDLPQPAQRSLRAKSSQLDLSIDTAKAIIQAYRASVSFVDAQVGQVLDALKKTGLDDNTLVIFLSDHGYHLGEHGHWQKQTLFEDATRVPLIVRGMQNVIPGSIAGQPVELIDLFPTVSTWAGIACDESLPGIDLFASWNSGGNPRQGAYTEWRKGATFRTKNLRITRWGEGGSLGWELYDHTVDPNELHNVADDASMVQTFDSLRHLMLSIESTNQQVPEAAGEVNRKARPIPRTPPILGQPHSKMP